MGLAEIKNNGLQEIAQAKDLKALASIRVALLGRKSEMTRFLRSLSQRTESERRLAGEEANQVKAQVSKALEIKKQELLEEATQTAVASEKIDISQPGQKVVRGHLHPITLVRRDVERIFSSMGFQSLEGPEIETEWYNFDALNIPRNHPARDLQDTFWIERKSDSHDSYLLRTHTSPMQIRFMEKHEPPFRIISPGRVFRNEATDMTHEFQLHQVEGLMVDRDISLAHLKGVLEFFFSEFIGSGTPVKFSADYFPFTEPSVGVHVNWKGKWLEVAGAGMVNQNVFKAVDYVPRDWQGFAFGMGLDRLTMLRYGIDDIRHFTQGDLRFLKQF
ncbi:MAG: phenylalanine--tRNA ligase subunit alpha [Candidatus Yanofskybacteria bacterium CG10_big_fil_rev_8_21_14_0_10_46_23]|uniref:Phenylalanine--tRNA ligase alpha subunit n=1 Tax=Candidatus Yanofskybacteria bacterium CG10_big_fil_rev_8_21_14_0_10_46_23 TaxID=1975098 RepID=A0A2H0R402_9BACT|nr:MAG: phenylalanine--tRNA ligase subunit alpha [Candidatus Yanofskybacteria bacterium CG10_big_fil_rev_8_21_14_0_10_46_23]